MPRARAVAMSGKVEITEGSPTPQKRCTDFEIFRIYPDFPDFKRFH